MRYKNGKASELIPDTIIRVAIIIRNSVCKIGLVDVSAQERQQALSLSTRWILPSRVLRDTGNEKLLKQAVIRARRETIINDQ